jgi:hypothetical protein
MVLSLLSITALAFDMGLLYTAKGEAQRAADAAALAGAQEFLHYVPATLAVPTARQHATDYAISNLIRNVRIDTSEVTVQVDPTLRRVHVFIRRQNIPLWFARLLGFATAPVAASAMAQASPASSTSCLAPLALPDWWHDPDDDDNNNLLPDSTETWIWGDDGTDYYEAFNNDATVTENGLGSQWRTDVYRDQGRLMIIKQQNPTNNPNNTSPLEIQPGWFYPLRLPNNDFASGGQATNKGANDFRNSFYDCDSGPIAVGDTLDLEMGNMKGPTYQAIDSVIAMDPTARWQPNPSGGGTIISPFGWDSPRIMTITLFDPRLLAQLQGNHTISPNNFALFFIEGREQGGGNQASIIGRFLQYANGAGGGTSGTLILRLQLIQ